jgi:sugar phosphate isomerase/epimerase
LSRRGAVAALAASAVAPLLPEFAAPAAAAQNAPPAGTVGGFLLGCQAYSFNRYTAFEAVQKTAEAGGVVIEFFPGQKLRPDADTKLDPNTPDTDLDALKAHLAKYGVRPVAFGVTGLGRDEASNRKTFEFARKLGLRTITSEPDPAGMDNIEKLVKEFDIRVAIHNHPKRANDPNYRYWDPQYVLSLVKGRDPRIGSCADTGHWVRSGIKPADALKVLRGRVMSSHLKDLNEFAPNAHDVPYGMGVSDIPAVLRELRSQKFDGHLSVEYEYHWESSVPEIAQCVGFVRGWSVTNR